MIGFSTTEAKVFRHITRNPQTVAELVVKTKMPRMTVYTILLRLKKKGFANSILTASGKRKMWFRNKESSIEKELTATRSFLFDDKIGGKTKTKKDFSGLAFFHGKEGIKDTLMHLTTRKDGVRMYSIQNSKNWKKWIELMGKTWVNEHNRMVVKHKLICFTIHSPQAPEDIKKDVEIIQAYKGRLGNSHAIPENFLKRDLSLYIFEDTIFLVNLENLEAVLFTNTDMTNFLIKMFAFMFEKGDEEEFFLKYNKG